MKKLIALLSIAAVLVTASAFAGRGGGGFSSGRSSFSSGRSSGFSSGRSSFSAPRSAPSKSYSAPSTPSRSSSFGTSSRGSFGRGSSTSRGSTFTPSSRGSYGRSSGMGDYKSSQYNIPKTNREVLSTSSTLVSTPYNSVPIYHYYYPTPWYGSGYSFYQYYYWSHFWGYHSHCYHNEGGLAVPRTCTVAKAPAPSPSPSPSASPSPKPSASPSPKAVSFWSGRPVSTQCSEGEVCDAATQRCKLKQ